MNPENPGLIVFFFGCMLAEKGVALVRRSKRARHARRPKRSVRYFRPQRDTNSKRVQSRIGLSVRAETLPGDLVAACAVLREALAAPGIVAIDEVQFLYAPEPHETIDRAKIDLFIETLIAGARNGCQIFLAGLDTDFRGEPFPISAALLLNPRVMKEHLTAICSNCLSEQATMTQRFIGGKPSSRSTPTLIVKGREARKSRVRYEPRCAFCHVLPD